MFKVEPTDYTPTRLKRWERQKDYVGEDMSDYYVGITYIPNKGNLIEESNFFAFGDEIYYQCVELKIDFYEYTRKDVFNHWLVGRYETFFIRADAPKELLEFADDLLQQVDDHIILNEDAYYEALGEAVEEYWASGNTVEIVKEAIAMGYAPKDYVLEDEDAYDLLMPDFVYEYIENILEN